MNWIGLSTLVVREIRRIFAIPMQTIFPPIITSLLYIFVFGSVLGNRISEILPGVSYIDFMIPGLLMMNVISSAFASTSSVIYIGKMMKTHEELLVAPLSYVEMVLGFIAAATLRGVIVGAIIYLVAVGFTASTIGHPLAFLFFLFGVSFLFASLGALVGLWGKTFDHINLPNTFILLPLSFLGGVFHSIHLLPEWMKILTYFNPIFYMINGIRASMLGVADISISISATVVVVLTVITFSYAVWLFKRGYNLRS
jgi:ABC-2 type transport system permease protein